MGGEVPRARGSLTQGSGARQVYEEEEEEDEVKEKALQENEFKELIRETTSSGSARGSARPSSASRSPSAGGERPVKEEDKALFTDRGTVQILSRLSAERCAAVVWRRRFPTSSARERSELSGGLDLFAARGAWALLTSMAASLEVCAA